jgi:hypothetical protein
MSAVAVRVQHHLNLLLGSSARLIPGSHLNLIPEMPQIRFVIFELILKSATQNKDRPPFGI